MRCRRGYPPPFRIGTGCPAFSLARRCPSLGTSTFDFKDLYGLFTLLGFVVEHSPAWLLPLVTANVIDALVRHAPVADLLTLRSALCRRMQHLSIGSRPPSSSEPFPVVVKNPHSRPERITVRAA